MTLMSWLHAKLMGPVRDVVSEAIDATDDATNKTRSLREQLQPYALADDPFAAMVNAHQVAEAYQQQTVEEPPE